jgi:hypothetical protein
MDETLRDPVRLFGSAALARNLAAGEIFAPQRRFSGPEGPMPESNPLSKQRCSTLADLIEAADGDDVVHPDDRASPIPPDAEPNRVVRIDFASGGAISKIVEIGVAHLQEVPVEGGQSAQADVRRLEIHHDNLTDQCLEQV